MVQTLREIAAAAKVSVSTASRALNGHPAISAETIERVRRAAGELRYHQRKSHVRNGTHRRLAQAKIGVISLGMDRSLIALPIMSTAVSGAEEALSEAEASVQLAHIPDIDNPPAGLLRQRFDGLVLSGALQGDRIGRSTQPLLERFRKIPSVWLVGRPSGCWGDMVGSNDYSTGVQAADYLAGFGHRHVAFLNPKPDHILFRRREDGFVAAAHRLGLRVTCLCESPVPDWGMPLSAPQGVEQVQSLVDRLIAMPERPTAVFAAADSVAALVYRALAVRGLSVGREMSVISGNNDVSLIAGLHPSLTTYDVHPHEIGRLAVRQLATRMSESRSLPDGEFLLSSNLVPGESVARL